MAKKLIQVKFEVFGVVQGVFFRKYTQKKGTELGLKGWCRNTSAGTVQGVLEGEPEKVNSMKKWLREEGSPSSRVDKAMFTEELPIDQHSFSSFEIRPDA